MELRLPHPLTINHVYNGLRWVGLMGLVCEHSPVRHAVKRRRVRTVMQTLIDVVSKLYEHGRRLSQHCPAFHAFQRVNTLRPPRRACADCNASISLPSLSSVGLARADVV